MGIGWLSSSRSSISLKTRLELGADAVHLVDEAEPGHVVLGGLPPDGLALRLDPLDGREDHHRAVEHAERPLDLGREVDVPRSVDDVDRDRLAASVLPAAGDRRRDDRDAPLALLLQIVGGGVALVDVSHPVDLAGVIEDPFRGGGLAGVDVGDDADVADPAEVRLGRGRWPWSSDPVPGHTDPSRRGERENPIRLGYSSRNRSHPGALENKRFSQPSTTVKPLCDNCQTLWNRLFFLVPTRERLPLPGPVPGRALIVQANPAYRQRDREAARVGRMSSLGPLLGPRTTRRCPLRTQDLRDPYRRSAGSGRLVRSGKVFRAPTLKASWR